jgi:DNA-binding transcriptional ArsR family regulator
MNLLPATVYHLDLSGSEFKLLTAFYEVADQYGRVQLDKIAISELTGISLSTLTRAFRKLEALGLLSTTRRRKGRNYFDENSYQLRLAKTGEMFPQPPHTEPMRWTFPSPAVGLGASEPSLKPSHEPAEPSLINEQSTSDYVAEVAVNTGSQVSGEETDLLRKSLSPVQSPGERAPRLENSESNQPLPKAKSKTRPSSPTPKSAPQKRVNNPRDARTRDLRPEREWNVYDVAAEFCAQVNSTSPNMPPLLNARTISGALSKMRKDLGIGPAEELLVMRRFFARSHNQVFLQKPETIAGTFLNMFKTSVLNEARQYGAGALAERETKRDRLRYPEKWEKLDREKAEREAQVRAAFEREKAQREARASAQRAETLAQKRLEDALATELRVQLVEHRRIFRQWKREMDSASQSAERVVANLEMDAGSETAPAPVPTQLFDADHWHKMRAILDSLL